MAVAAENMDGLLRNLKWPAKSTLKVKSDYFTGGNDTIKRTVLPVSEAGEGPATTPA